MKEVRGETKAMKKDISTIGAQLGELTSVLMEMRLTLGSQTSEGEDRKRRKEEEPVQPAPPQQAPEQPAQAHPLQATAPADKDAEMGTEDDKKEEARRERSPRRESPPGAMSAFPQTKAKAAAKPFRQEGEVTSVG